MFRCGAGVADYMRVYAAQYTQTKHTVNSITSAHFHMSGGCNMCVYMSFYLFIYTYTCIEYSIMYAWTFGHRPY